MTQRNGAGPSAGHVLLLGNYRAALAVARELAPLGHTLTVTRGGGEGCTEFSRFVTGVWDEPDLKQVGDEGFVDRLASFLDARPDITIVMPVAEPYAVALARFPEKLPADRLVASPTPATVLTCFDKPALFAIAEAEGVPFAKTEVVTDLATLHTKTQALGFPIVVRPLVSETRLLGEKALVLDDEAAMSAAMPIWPAPHESLIVQQKVLGRRVNFYFAAQHGELLRALEATILKTDRADGSGLATAGETVPLSPELLDYTRCMAKALGYHGVGCAQFLVDPKSGSVNFLEINPRIAGHHAVTTAAGLDLASLAISLAAGGNQDGFREGQSGLRYTWTFGALRGVRHNASSLAEAVGGATATFARALRSNFHMTWRLTDPMPTVNLYARALRPSGPVKTKNKHLASAQPSRGSTSNA